MIYEESEITSLLNCDHCSQPYDEYYQPRMLPCCGKTICYQCVQLIEKQAKNSKFKCVSCNKEGTIPNEGLIVNQLAVKLLAKQPKEISRGTEADKLKQNLIDLENLLNKLIFEMENGDYLITEDCKELKRQVQLAKEEKIQEINQQCDALFLKIDTYEEMCKSKYKEINESKQKTQELIKLVSDSIQQQNAYLSQLKIYDRVTMKCNLKISDLKEKIAKERKNIKKSLYGNLMMKFEVNKTKMVKDVLGKIIHPSFEFTKILSASYRTLKLYDLRSGECVKTYIGHSNWVQNVKLLNDNQIVSSSQDKTIKVWDIKSGDCIQTLLGHSDTVWCIEILSNDRFASGSLDRTIRIWKVSSGCCLKIIKGHTESIFCIARLSDERLLSGSADKSIKLWNFDSGECLRTIEGHMNTVECLELISFEKMMSGSFKTIKVWDIKTGKCLQTLEGHTDGVICIKVLSEDRIISGSKDRTIKIWCLKTGSCIKTIIGHTDEVTGIQVLSTEKVASCSTDKTIIVWDVDSASCIQSFQRRNCILSIDVF